MPYRDSTRLATKPLRNERMMGMPAATLASNIKSAPFASASSKSSSPRSASMALLAVTTSLPCRRASLTHSKAGGAPVSSTTSCTSGSATTALASAVNRSGARAGLRGLSKSRTATRCNAKSTCLRRRSDAGASCNSSTTPLPTVPKPIKPTPIGMSLPNSLFRIKLKALNIEGDALFWQGARLGGWPHRDTLY